MRLVMGWVALLWVVGCGEQVFYLGEPAQFGHTGIGAVEPPLQLLWQRNLDGAPLGGALFAGSLALQLTTSPSLHAYDRRTGVKLGKKGFDQMACGPGLLVGELFLSAVLGGDPGMLALDRRTLEERWHHPGVFCQTPVVSGDTLLLVDEEGKIMALRVDDGEELWQVELQDRVRAGLALGEDMIFVGSAKGDLLALDSADGSEIWRLSLGEALRSRPMLAAGHLYTATAGGQVVAVDVADGLVVWQQALGGLLTEHLVVEAGVLVAGCVDRHIYGLDARTGEVRWSFATQGVVRSSPAVTAQTVYCAASDGYLYALELQSGLLLWKYKLDGPVLAPVTLGAGILGVVSEKQTLYVFGHR